jgi:hypothetical protein
MSRTRGVAVLIACCALQLAALPASGSGQTAVPAGQRPSYRLQARLDPNAGVVHGREHIRFVNNSRAALGELYFHLYANAFASKRTVFMREGGSSLRSTALARPGGIAIEKLDGGMNGAKSDLLAHAQNELIADDRTQLRVPLPAPLAPGAAIELDVEFELRVPAIVARMGRADDFFMIAQWYPKLAKLEPDGRWVSFPYHGLGEFYADFADHELELEVPSEYVIATSGMLEEARDTQAGTRIERYVLNDALDVAWAAYPSFRRERMNAGGVELEAFAPPGHTALARAQLALMRDGLARLGTKLVPYPYARLVLVLPPSKAYGASGMEYPGLIVGATASWHSELDGISGIVHDSTTTHELAHQWFPLLIASNELQAPVLDEGLAQWLGMDLLRDRYGRTGFWQRLIDLPADLFEVLRAGYVRGREPPSSLLPAWKYHPNELGPAIYARPALALETLRRTQGEPFLWTALAHYARAHQHQNPTPQALFTAFSPAPLPPLLQGDGPAKLQSETQGRSCQIVIAIRGSRAAKGPDDARVCLLDRTVLGEQTRVSASAPQLPWLARILYWAQLVLTAVGA